MKDLNVILETRRNAWQEREEEEDEGGSQQRRVWLCQRWRSGGEAEDLEGENIESQTQLGCTWEQDKTRTTSPASGRPRRGSEEERKGGVERMAGDFTKEIKDLKVHLTTADALNGRRSERKAGSGEPEREIRGTRGEIVRSVISRTGGCWPRRPRKSRRRLEDQARRPEGSAGGNRTEEERKRKALETDGRCETGEKDVTAKSLEESTDALGERSERGRERRGGSAERSIWRVTQPRGRLYSRGGG